MCYNVRNKECKNGYKNRFSWRKEGGECERKAIESTVLAGHSIGLA